LWGKYLILLLCFISMLLMSVSAELSSITIKLLWHWNHGAANQLAIAKGITGKQ
jgi:hypothetical protein